MTLYEVQVNELDKDTDVGREKVIRPELNREAIRECDAMDVDKGFEHLKEKKLLRPSTREKRQYIRPGVPAPQTIDVPFTDEYLDGKPVADKIANDYANSISPCQE